MAAEASLPATLQAALAALPDGPLCAAVSGGADSIALLHALAQLEDARGRGLRAVHVDHGLHPDSFAWADHVQRLCASLDVPLDVRRVRVTAATGQGPEAAARDARYRALGERLEPGGILVLAHHRDDQLETVLLKLLRGAGPEGLAGMHALRPFARGHLWRPLLDTPRQALRDYLHAHRLRWIEDPSNGDATYTRNRLRRNAVAPMLETLPNAAAGILHSAALCREAAAGLQRPIADALHRLRDQATESLDAAGWRVLPEAVRHLAMERWLHTQRLPAPTTAQRTELERQARAAEGQEACVRWPGVEVHVWKGRLWARKPQPTPDGTWQAEWSGEPLALPDGGMLDLPAPALLVTPLRVRLRRGGERLRPLDHPHTRALRDLFQQALLPPWLRAACPLIYEGDTLVAVADRWLTARGDVLFTAAGGRPRWQPGTTGVT